MNFYRCRRLRAACRQLGMIPNVLGNAARRGREWAGAELNGLASSIWLQT